MELKLYDTLTREKRVFSPLDPTSVRMYVCGPTVYDFAHIGNARPVIVFDVLFRLLRYRYGADCVTYVRNITDVDDKINARAAEDCFHKTKSAAFFLWASTATRAPAFCSSSLRPDNAPYSGIDSTSNSTSPPAS